MALANSRGFAAGYDATQAWAYASAFAGEGADLMTGLGVELGRDPDELDPEAIGAEAADRALALVGRAPAREPALPGRAGRVRRGLVHRLHRLDAVRRGRAARALAVRRPRGRRDRRRRARARRRRDRPRGPVERALRRRGLAQPAHAADRGRPAADVPVRRPHRAPGRAGDDRQRDPRLVPLAAVGRDDQPGARARASTTSTGCSAAAGEGLFVTDVAGLHSGVNPVSGTFSVGASGRLIEGGEPGTPVRELTIASDLVSMLQSGARGGVAGALGAVRRQREGAADPGRRDGDLGRLSRQTARKNT